jgi:hypothetical protein
MSTHDDDPLERARVYQTIAPIIQEFFGQRGATEFHVEELRQYVLDRAATIAPDSPGRILRAMRQNGILDYLVIDRRRSLYRFCDQADPDFQGGTT